MNEHTPSIFSIIADILTFGAAALAFTQSFLNKGKLEEIHVLVDGRMAEALEKIQSLEKRITALKADPGAEDGR